MSEQIKYRLLKELPFCPIGTIGYINNIGDLIIDRGENYKHYYDNVEIKKLIEEGWIEEIKPESQEDLWKEIFNAVNTDSSRNIKFEETLESIIDNFEIKRK